MRHEITLTQDPVEPAYPGSNWQGRCTCHAFISGDWDRVTQAMLIHLHDHLNGGKLGPLVLTAWVPDA